MRQQETFWDSATLFCSNSLESQKVPSSEKFSIDVNFDFEAVRFFKKTYQKHVKWLVTLVEIASQFFMQLSWVQGFSYKT